MTAPWPVLIVDDDASVTASLALLLKQAGHASPAAATPGRGARAAWRRARSPSSSRT